MQVQITDATPATVELTPSSRPTIRGPCKFVQTDVKTDVTAVALYR